MTLDEAIQDHRDNAKLFLEEVEKIDPLLYADDTEVIEEVEQNLTRLATYNSQIADWLEDYKISERALRYAAISIYTVSHRTSFLEDFNIQDFAKGIDNIVENFKRYAHEDIQKERRKE